MENPILENLLLSFAISGALAAEEMIEAEAKAEAEKFLKESGYDGFEHLAELLWGCSEFFPGAPPDERAALIQDGRKIFRILLSIAK